MDGEFNISLKLKTGEGQEWLKANDMIQVRKALEQDLSSIIDWDKADQKIQNGVSNLRPKNEFIESLKLICSKKFHVKLPIYVISTNKHGILRVDLE